MHITTKTFKSSTDVYILCPAGVVHDHYTDMYINSTLQIALRM